MSISSIAFMLFVGAVMAVYFLMPDRFKWIVLLAASYVFYALNSFAIAYYLVFTTVTVFVIALLIEKLNIRQRAELADKPREWLLANRSKVTGVYKKKKRWMLTIGLLLNFGILFTIKYFNFLSMGLTDVFNGIFGWSIKPFELDLLMPLGISFYTFQSLGYLMDVYKSRCSADRNIAKFALFVSFFPQIIQGPIGRYNQLAPQLYAPHKFDYTRICHGGQLILWGLFKKILIADRLSGLVGTVLTNAGTYNGLEIALGVLAYMFNIYTNFSGGIDIARGVAQCLGIDMAENFKRPFFAISTGDYWRRWHITLGEWMRDYLLYPLSLSKAFGRMGRLLKKIFGDYIGKVLPTSLAMMIVFLAVGIWHGANAKFIAFGLYNGVFIILGILLKPAAARFNKLVPWFTTKNLIIRIFAILMTLFFIFIGKYFPAADSLYQSIELLKNTVMHLGDKVQLVDFMAKTGFTIDDAISVGYGLLIMLIVGLMQEGGMKIREFIDRQFFGIRWVIYIVLIISIIFFGQGIASMAEGDFIYANF